MLFFTVVPCNRAATDDRSLLMNDEPTTATGRLAGMIGIFVLLGTPLVAYLWGTLNELMSGFIDSRRLLISLPMSLLLVAHLVWMARTVRKFEAERAPSVHRDHPLSR